MKNSKYTLYCIIKIFFLNYSSVKWSIGSKISDSVEPESNFEI